MPTDAKGPKRTCQQCRGVLLWDAAAGALRCQLCGAVEPVPTPASPADPGQAPKDFSEHDLEAALAQRKPRGRIGSGARQVRCDECHAEVELPDEVQATRCEFCGASMLVERLAAEDHYLPESIVPFSIDRAAAVRAFGNWLGELWLRPSNLRRAASLHELHGIYIPYWAFGCEVTSRFTADAGYTTWEDEYVIQGGRQIPKQLRKRVSRVRWEPCSGQRHDRHEDHLICASRGLAPLDGAASRFDISGLMPYSPEYLLGFAAERYAIDLPESWQRARQAICAMQDRRCAGDVPGDTHRNLRATHQFQRVRFKHVLLPMWVATYRYQSPSGATRLHRFLVNGQTGQVAGTAPRSAWKIVLLVAALLAVIAALAYVIRSRQPRPQAQLSAVSVSQMSPKIGKTAGIG